MTSSSSAQHTITTLIKRAARTRPRPQPAPPPCVIVVVGNGNTVVYGRNGAVTQGGGGRQGK